MRLVLIDYKTRAQILEVRVVFQFSKNRCNIFLLFLFIYLRVFELLDSVEKHNYEMKLAVAT